MVFLVVYLFIYFSLVNSSFTAVQEWVICWKLHTPLYPIAVLCHSNIYKTFGWYIYSGSQIYFILLSSQVNWQCSFILFNKIFLSKKIPGNENTRGNENSSFKNCLLKFPNHARILSTSFSLPHRQSGIIPGVNPDLWYLLVYTGTTVTNSIFNNFKCRQAKIGAQLETSEKKLLK